MEKTISEVITGIVKKLESQGVYKCPRCEEEYNRPMTNTGFCGPCNYKSEVEKAVSEIRKTKPESIINEVIDFANQDPEII